MHKTLPKREQRLEIGRVISASLLSALLLLGQTAPLLANPSGGAVVAGSATIGSAGATLSINQSTQKAIINWQQFSIAGGETTKFIVPNSGATLNRVVGGNLSAIYGSLQSNGALYLINPNGILVGPSGRINTTSFLGSTLDVTNQQFLAGGDLNLTGSSAAPIDNEGIIHATGGDVYLIANQVTNAGTLSAPHGTVGLAAGNDVLFKQAGSQHLFVSATPAGTKRAVGVTNSGTIRAAAAELKAAGGNAYALAINNTGAIAATGYKKVNGQVYLTSDGGSISNSGTISAHQANGNGGTIVISGYGNSANGTVLNSGTVNAAGTASGSIGGSVELLGNSVGIMDDGIVDVSGDAGGGTALIGGDEHGANPDVADADHTYLGPDAQIDADALTLGNGGKVILWGNDTTQVYGQINATGGAQGGNGGVVETSATQLDARTAPDLTAPDGTAGTWLLDPSTVTISDTATDSGFTTPPAFTINSGTVTISQATLLTALESGNVTIDASTGSGGAGTITWTQSSLAFDISNAGGHTLTLDAPVSLTLNGITVNATGTGGLNLVLNASLTGSGNVVVENSTLNLNGGSLAANGNGYVSAVDSNGSEDGVDIFDTSINARGGNINLTGNAGYVTSGGAVTSGLGVGIGTDGNASTALTTTGTGNITIDGTFNQNVTSSGYLAAVAFESASPVDTNTVSVVNGTISVTGTVSQGKANGTTQNTASIGGVEVQTGTTIEATGAGGSISLTGDTSGATSLIQPGVFSFIQGVEVSGNLSVATGGSITLHGTSGTVDTSNSTLDDSSNDTPFSAGVIADNMTLTTGANSTVTIMGTSGPVITTGAYTGGSEGVELDNDSTFTLGTGNTVTITGQGGAVNAGNGTVLGAGDTASSNGVEMSGALTLANGGSLSVMGTGGTLNTSGTTADPGSDLPSDSGIKLGHGANVSALGSSTITLMGTSGALNSGSGKVGNAVGVIMTSDSGETSVLSSQAGAIQITGQGGLASNLGVGVLITGVDGGTTTIESTTGNISITGTGGGGNTSPGTYTGFYEPNYGVLVFDAATVQTTAGGNIQFTGTGVNTPAIATQELASGNEVDTSPVAPQIFSSGNVGFSTTTGNDIDITNTTLTAQNATFSTAAALNITETGNIISLGGDVDTPSGSGYVNITNGTTITAGNATLTAAGPLFINDSTININVGGNFVGSGNGLTNATDQDKTDGIDIFNSTIDVQGGNISLTGIAGYSNVSSVIDGGIGVQVGNDGLGTTTTIETSGAGNITISGTFAQSITSESNIQGFADDSVGDVLSVASGELSITGTVSQGTTGSASSSSDASGIQIGDAITLQATASGGSISLTGSDAGSTSIDSTTDSSESAGIEIGGDSGASAVISVATNGSITLHGTGGANNSSNSTSENDIGGSEGVDLSGGTQLTAGTGSTITITGQGGSATGGLYVGSADGVHIGQSDAGSTVTISVATGGSINLNGTGGTQNASNAAAITSNDVPGTEGVSVDDNADITALGTATITIMGTGGTVTSGANGFGNALGVAIGSSSTSNPGPVTISSGSGTIAITGHGGTTPDLGTGVVIYGFNNELVTIKSTTGNIALTGTGGSGYTGSGSITGFSVPNDGVAVTDDSVLQTGGTGSISLVGTGGANSKGVSVQQFPSGSFDPTPNTAPTITAGGALTINALSGTGIYLQGTFNAASAALGTGTTGNFASITSGALTIQNSAITTTGGNITGFGKGDTFDADGIDMEGSTLNAQGGTISLTGQAIAYVYNQSSAPALDGLNIAGEGALIDSSLVETTGTGGINIYGDASVATTVQDALIGLEVASSNVTTVNGPITLTGTVNSGTALATTNANSAGFGGDGVEGVSIGADFMSSASVVSATGTGGSIAIIGNTFGSTSDASDSTSDEHDNEGFEISGNGTTVSSAGNATAYINGGTTYTGIYIQGTSGALINNRLGGTVGDQNAANTAGLSVSDGALIQATNAAQITIVGLAGTNTTLGNAELGSAAGAVINSNGSNGSTQDGATSITSASGNISISGTAGSSPDKGVGVAVHGKNGVATNITSTSGAIVLTGLGGPGNSVGVLAPGTGDGSGMIPNDGVALLGGAVLQTGSTAGIAINGGGAGVNGAAILVDPFGQTTAPTLAAANGPVNLTSVIASSSGGDIILTNDSLPSTPDITALSATFNTQGVGAVVVIDQNIELNGGTFTAVGTALGTTQSTYTDGVQVSGSTIDPLGGGIELVGRASTLSNVAGEGVEIDTSVLENTSSTQTTITSGDITITGFGSPGTGVTVTNDLLGVEINSSMVSVTSGALSLTGTVANGTADGDAEGIEIDNGATIESTGSGSVTFDGSTTGSTAETINAGVFLTGNDPATSTSLPTEITAAGGAGISITGFAGAVANSPVGTNIQTPDTEGVRIEDGFSITTTGTAPIAITGTGGTDSNPSATGGQSRGISFGDTQVGVDNLVNSVSGAISLNGTGGSSANNVGGIDIDSDSGGTSGVTSSSGNITLVGSIPNQVGAAADGLGAVNLSGDPATGVFSTVQTQTGSVSIAGTVTSGSGVKVAGIVIGSGSQVGALGPSSNVILSGHTAGSTAQSFSAGVYISGAGTEVTAGDGGMTITGNAGALSGTTGTIVDSSTGIYYNPLTVGIGLLDGAEFRTTGTGTMTLTGTGGANTNTDPNSSSAGVDIFSPQTPETTSIQSGGNLLITGIAGTSTSLAQGILVGGPSNMGTISVIDDGTAALMLTSTAGDIDVTVPGINASSATFDSAADVNISGTGTMLDFPAGTLTVDAVGSIFDSAPVSVGTFLLENGTWTQIVGQNGLASLPSFAATDFVLEGTGSTFERFAGGTGASGTPYQITDVYGLQGLASPSNDLLGADAELVNNIDATGTSGWNSGAGFTPIGGDEGSGANTTPPFTGTFNGQFYRINGLHITNDTDVALFGGTSGALIENVGLTNIQVSGVEYVGALVGYFNNNGTLLDDYSTGSVTSSSYSVGGLVGVNAGTISNSFSTATVDGFYEVGGLVGYSGGTITNSYSTGSVAGTGQDYYVAGFVGYNNGSGTISNSYSTGAVNGGGSEGGFVGENLNIITNSFWDSDTAGLAIGVGSGTTTGVTAATTAQLQSQNFILANATTAPTFNFTPATGVWGSDGLMGTSGGTVQVNNGLPYFQWQYATPIALVANNQTVTYGNAIATDASQYSVVPGTATLANYITGGVTLVGSLPTSTSVGTYTGAIGFTVQPDVGVTIEQALGDETITASSLTVVMETGVTANNKVYDSTNAATLNFSSYTLSGVMNGDTITINPVGYTATFASANAGNGIAVTVSNLGLSSTNAGNYSLTQPTGLTANITPAPLTVTANPQTTTYSATAYSGGNGVTYAGFQGNDNATSLAGTLAYSGTSQGAINVANYIITPGGYTVGNYSYTYNSGALTINPAQLTVTANPQTTTYSATAYSGGNGVTYAGFQGTDNAASLTGTLAYSGTSQGAVNAGGYVIAPGGYTVGNYTYTYNSGALTISPAQLTVTANPQTTTYSATAYSGGNGVTYAGFQGNDNAASLAGTLTYSGASQGAVDAGGYAITPGGYTVGNYTYVYNNGNLTISPAALTASLTGTLTKVYDGTTVAPVSAANIALAGLQGNDTVGVSGTVTYSTQNVSMNDAVTVTGLGLTGAKAADYQVSPNSLAGNTGAITPAALTITANNENITPGSQIPAFTASYAGLASTDTPSVLNGTLVFDTSPMATSASPNGSYSIIPSGLSDPNYQIQFIMGTLTIAPMMMATNTQTMTVVSTSTGGAVDGGSNIVPPVLTPQPTTTADTSTTPTTTTFSLGNGADTIAATAPTQPFSFTGGTGSVTQTGDTTGVLVQSSGNSGNVGSGDVAQMNQGQLNNVASPHASSELNEALGPVVYHNLQDALQAVGDWTDTTAPTDSDETAAAGDAETILTGGEVAEVSGTSVKDIPMSAAPEMLRNALAGDVFKGVGPAH